jgi:hypothetical protein
MFMDWPMSYDGPDIQVWAETAASAYLWPLLVWAGAAVILLLLAMLVTSFPVRRRFWCDQAGQEVDVAFEEDGPGGLRRFVAVVSCSAFAPSTHVRCDRACLSRDISALERRRPS